MTAPEQKDSYTPPFPDPRVNRPNLLQRFWASRKSWLNVFFTKSYRMKSGRFRVPGKTYFVVNEAQDVRAILNDKASAYPKGRVLQQMLKLLLNDGFFVSNGDTWKRQRSMMEQALTQAHIRKAFPQMVSAVEQLLQRLDKRSAGNAAVNISEEMAHVTADIIFRTIFSKPLTAEQSSEVFNAFAKYQGRIARLVPLFYVGAKPEWFYWLVGKPANAIRSVIQQSCQQRFDHFHATGEDPYDDILNGIITAQDESGTHFTMEEIIDQIGVLFLAGHETSATTLSWVFFILSRCPHFQQQIRAEMRDVMAETGADKLDFSHIRKLKQCSNVFRETLRLYPPVGGFIRESKCPVKFRDKQIKPGDSVFVIPWLLHRREDKWPQTHEFHPERFSCPEQQEVIRDYYYPFSAGERVCIGAGFANQEAILILASVVSRFEILPADGPEPQPVGHLTIKPDRNVVLHLRNLTES
ncbi:cytochrome P450 [Oceanobacter mangrovi]|uniref:cytochrome P450 n=1 Tax=Oceanobacter mangrovi TaxID=2862510 RepID=UPI001C8D7F60|nr:cytochrome P450 [Oceanobacter mangrovi]